MAVFKNKYPAISQETIDLYFSEYTALYVFAESNFSVLAKQQDHGNEVKKEFFEIITNKYKWVDKSNLEKLYDVCRFYLR